MTKPRCSPNTAAGENKCIIGGWDDDFCLGEGAGNGAVHAGPLGWRARPMGDSWLTT
jgi:hypothetical protein